MKAYTATGRRKNAIAQVRLLSPGSGRVKINKREFEDYLPVELNRTLAIRALTVLDLNASFDVAVTVRGGGMSGQTGAIQLAISRALLQYDEQFRSKLRRYGLLTRDPRMVERKKYGQKKARKRFQFSKR